MVSLKDIAQRCGVSTATVSKALHDQKDIGAETKNRIKKIAKEMGYLPNAAARVLKTNESNNIGVLYFDEAAMGLTHEYFAGVLNGIKAQAEMLGYDITFINTSPVGKKLSYLEHCKYRNFDGVVIVCARFQDNEVQELMSSDIPVVTIDYIHYSCSAVCSNNVKCMGDLLDYIISMGHNKFSILYFFLRIGSYSANSSSFSIKGTFCITVLVVITLLPFSSVDSSFSADSTVVITDFRKAICSLRLICFWKSVKSS